MAPKLPNLPHFEACFVQMLVHIFALYVGAGVTNVFLIVNCYYHAWLLTLSTQCRNIGSSCGRTRFPTSNSNLQQKICFPADKASSRGGMQLSKGTLQETIGNGKRISRSRTKNASVETQGVDKIQRNRWAEDRLFPWGSAQDSNMLMKSRRVLMNFTLWTERLELWSLAQKDLFLGLLANWSWSQISSFPITVRSPSVIQKQTTIHDS